MSVAAVKFTVTFVTDAPQAILRFRGLLKLALRRFGLRAIHVGMAGADCDDLRALPMRDAEGTFWRHRSQPKTGSG